MTYTDGGEYASMYPEEAAARYNEWKPVEEKTDKLKDTFFKKVKEAFKDMYVAFAEPLIMHIGYNMNIIYGYEVRIYKEKPKDWLDASIYYSLVFRISNYNLEEQYDASLEDEADWETQDIGERTNNLDEVIHNIKEFIKKL